MEIRAAGGSREEREGRWPEAKRVNLNLWMVGNHERVLNREGLGHTAKRI